MVVSYIKMTGIFPRFTIFYLKIYVNIINKNSKISVPPFHCMPAAVCVCVLGLLKSYTSAPVRTRGCTN